VTTDATDPPGQAGASAPSDTEETTATAAADEDASPIPAGDEAPPVPEGDSSAGDAPPPVPAGDETHPVPAGNSAAVFNQARPVARDAGTVQGEIPDPEAFVDTRRIFGDTPGDAAGRSAPRGEDGLVGMAFVQDLAAFLAENYWPAGTHPLARSRGVTTADLKWANNKYGVQLDGFRVNRANPASDRQRILRHVLTPSMVKGLYALYQDRFIEALAHEAATRQRSLGDTERTLNPAETAQMFGLYAGQARGLAGAMRAYFADEGHAAQVMACIAAEEHAAAAHLRYQESLAASRSAQATPAREYQNAVVRREQERANLAAALRRSGNTRGLDTESLVFVAMWLHRRSLDDVPALHGIIAALDDLADRLEAKGASYRSGRRTTPGP
jgi:hypothetical protein